MFPVFIFLNVKSHGFPKRIDHHVQVVCAVPAVGERARREIDRPVRAVPMHVLTPIAAACDPWAALFGRQSYVERSETCRGSFPVTTNRAMSFRCPGCTDCYCRVGC